MCFYDFQIKIYVVHKASAESEILLTFPRCFYAPSPIVMFSLK